MTITKFFLKNIRKTKKLFILLILTFSIASMLIPLETYISSRILGCFEYKNKEDALNHCLLILSLMVIYYLVRGLINGYYLSYIREAFKSSFLSHVSTELFAHIHKHNISYFDDEMSGRISFALAEFSEKISALLSIIPFSCVRPLISLIFSLVIISTFSPSLALFLLITVICYGFLVYTVNARWFNLNTDCQKANNAVNGIITDSFANSNLVKYVGSFFSEQLHFYIHLKKALRLHVKREQFHILSRFLFHTLDTIFLCTCIVFLIFKARSDNIAIKDLFFVYASLFQMLMAIMQLTHFIPFINRYLASLKVNFELINKPISIIDSPNAQKLVIRKAPSISLKNIDFSYTENKPIYQNLNLNIKAGEKVGLVGISGSGKSTLINLILRSYAPTSGSICINNIDISDITQDSLHKNIAVVAQDSSLFNRSIYENLRIANSHATKKEIEKAAKLAQIHDTILNLPNGYDSVVGERGVLLSGGERQRISIARAILQNAPILILDEATSSLDSQSETAIKQALYHIMQRKTVIAIAHRLSTLNNMDRIIVLDKGRIVEDDTPSELLKNSNGIFSSLYQKQINGYINYGEQE